MIANETAIHLSSNEVDVDIITIKQLVSIHGIYTTIKVDFVILNLPLQNKWNGTFG